MIRLLLYLITLILFLLFAVFSPKDLKEKIKKPRLK